MEYVSVLAGEPWSDHPRCTHPLLSAAARGVNDTMNDAERRLLLRLAPCLIGTDDDRPDQVARHSLAAGMVGWSLRRLPPATPAGVGRIFATAVDAAADIAAGLARGERLEQAGLAAVEGLAVVEGVAGLRSPTELAARAVRRMLEVPALGEADVGTALTAATYYAAQASGDRIAFLCGLLACRYRLAHTVARRPYRQISAAWSGSP